MVVPLVLIPLTGQFIQIHGIHLITTMVEGLNPFNRSIYSNEILNKELFVGDLES